MALQTPRYKLAVLVKAEERTVQLVDSIASAPYLDTLSKRMGLFLQKSTPLVALMQQLDGIQPLRLSTLLLQEALLPLTMAQRLQPEQSLENWRIWKAQKLQNRTITKRKLAKQLSLNGHFEARASARPLFFG
jgi:hypothetical protein